MIEENVPRLARTIRPPTIPRKDALSEGSDGGEKTWATIAALLATAKLKGADPHAWLTRNLERLAADRPSRLIDDFSPKRRKTPRAMSDFG